MAKWSSSVLTWERCKTLLGFLERVTSPARRHAWYVVRKSAGHKILSYGVCAANGSDKRSECKMCLVIGIRCLEVVDWVFLMPCRVLVTTKL